MERQRADGVVPVAVGWFFAGRVFAGRVAVGRVGGDVVVEAGPVVESFAFGSGAG
jgi:hypothetical protein